MGFLSRRRPQCGLCEQKILPTSLSSYLTGFHSQELASKRFCRKRQAPSPALAPRSPGAVRPPCSELDIYRVPWAVLRGSCWDSGDSEQKREVFSGALKNNAQESRIEGARKIAFYIKRGFSKLTFKRGP